jgi:predicted phage terminase large subunit-like protein
MSQKVDLNAWLTEPGNRDAFARSYFGGFATEMFQVLHPGVTLQWAPYLDLLCSVLHGVAIGKLKRVIITLPPRHLKSELCSIFLPAYFLALHPEKSVMCVSYGQDLVDTFAQATRTIMTSPRYRELFGQVLLSPRQASSHMRTLRNGGRRSVSLQGGATGHGADVVIFDDPQKAQDVSSETIRRSTNTSYENVFLSRQQKAGESAILIVMQRFHEDDFVGHVLSLNGDWLHINLPALAEVDEAIPFWTPLGERVFRRRPGEALHPRRFSKEELEKRRQEIGPEQFATQYQQNPAPAGGGIVETAWFQTYRPEDLPEEFHTIVQSWDTASKDKRWNDFSACTTWGVHEDRFYLLDVYRARLKFPVLKPQVIALAERYGAHEVYIEDNASGTALIQDLQANSYMWVRAFIPKGTKEERMVGQANLLREKRVYIPETAPWKKAYLHEFAMFPNGTHDDQVDSTSQALRAMTDWSNGRGFFEAARREHAQLVKAGLVPDISAFMTSDARPPILAEGSMEWKAEQKRLQAQKERLAAATAGAAAASSPEEAALPSPPVLSNWFAGDG